MSTGNLYIEPVTNEARLPEKKTDHAACYDIRLNLVNRNITYIRGSGESQTLMAKKSYEIYPGERALLPTGLKMCCDPGWKIEVAPRSGNAFKLGITLINAIGVLDADYRDEAMLLIVNHGNNAVTLKDGERFAQLSLEVVNDVNLIVGKLPKTESNRVGGIGSSGNT